MINFFDSLIKDGTLKKRIKNFLKQDSKRVIIASNSNTDAKEKRRKKVLV